MRRQLKQANIGDHVEKALETVGITKERLEAWLGRPCKCRERKRRLNEIGQWAYRIISGGQHDNAKEEFDKIVGEEKPQSEEPSK